MTKPSSGLGARDWGLGTVVTRGNRRLNFGPLLLTTTGLPSPQPRVPSPRTSDRPSEPILQLLPIPPAERQASARAEQDGVLAVQPGLELLDPFHVDDPGAMDPEE